MDNLLAAYPIRVLSDESHLTWNNHFWKTDGWEEARYLGRKGSFLD